MNHYVVLGIDEDADRETIRRAFRGLVRRYHPDAGAGSSADAFLRVVEAYETLNDPERRRIYDRGLRHARLPHTRERVVEPLSNRNAVEPISSTRVGSLDDRPPVDIISFQIHVDALFEQLFRSVDASVWFGRRWRHF